MKPKRIQRKRTKGWRMPENAMSVTRPSRWGNPFVIGERFENLALWIAITGKTLSEKGIAAWHRHHGIFVKDASLSVRLFKIYARWKMSVEPAWLDPLRDKDLACF